MFDRPEMVKYAQIPESEIDSDSHRQLALKTAQESIVLLKNDGVLPFSPAVKKIAVVGPLAESLRVLQGNYSGTPSRATSALAGIRRQFANAQVSFVPGMNFLRQEVLIPTSVLSTPDEKQGLKGQYFLESNFEGTPTVRIDPIAMLQPFHPEPGARTPPPHAKNFSVRWTGYLTPEQAGSYH